MKLEVVVELIDELKNDNLFYSIVNEAGASIYSASKLGQEEFPDLDVTVEVLFQLQDVFKILWLNL